MTKIKDPEERTATVSGRSKQEPSSRSISDRALEMVSQGARTNPDGETTVFLVESGGETTVYRIFRGRHKGGGPLKAADPWIQKVKEHCTSISGELKATAVWTDVDGSSALLAITGRRIIGREETE